MPLIPPFTFNVDVKAESGKPFEATIVGVTDGTSGATMTGVPAALSEAYAEVAKLSAPKIPGGSSSQSSRGGKSRKGRKSLRRK